MKSRTEKTENIEYGGRMTSIFLLCGIIICGIIWFDRVVWGYNTLKKNTVQGGCHEQLQSIRTEVYKFS